MSEDIRTRMARKGRMTALVIVGTAIYWVVGLFIGKQMGWSQRDLALIDLTALAGFIFAIVNILQIWRLRQKLEG